MTKHVKQDCAHARNKLCVANIAGRGKGVGGGHWELAGRSR